MHFLNSAFQALLASALFASTAFSHATVWHVHVNGASQGRFTGLRVPGAPSYDTSYNGYPVKDLTSPEIACNINGDVPAATWIPVVAGDTISFEWHHFNDSPTDDIIAAHKIGTQTVHIHKVSPGTSINSPESWTKIAQEAWNPATRTWPANRLRANKGLQTPFTLPETLAPGKYILRTELVALFEADTSYAQNPLRGAQFFPNCAQIEVIASEGSDSPPGDTSFPGTYQYNHPGIKYNIYTGMSQYQNYPIPGNAVWNP